MGLPTKCTCCGGIGQLAVLGTQERYPCDLCNGTGNFVSSAYTCNECSHNSSCKCAWDCYNTNGDCLMSK